MCVRVCIYIIYTLNIYVCICHLFLVQKSRSFIKLYIERLTPTQTSSTQFFPTLSFIATTYSVSLLHSLSACFYASTSKFKYTCVSPFFFPKSYLIINTFLHLALSTIYPGDPLSWQLKHIRIQANLCYLLASLHLRRLANAKEKVRDLC